MMRTAALVLVILAAAARSAAAFCGFYVAGGDQKMFNDATQVVLMRMGTRTVLAMQNNYQGPPAAFAMVVPVPVVLHEGDVKTLPRDVFERVERMGAPRLVEYWEQDPCGVDYRVEGDFVTKSSRPPAAAAPSGGGGLGVTIEAQFTVAEYKIVILSARDSTGLETWLLRERYKIPEGAEPLLRPYVESGSKFFVAKVDPAKVTFDAGGRAALSPLRFHYDTEEFALPIRLGLASSSGTQDLIVNILAPNQRYEVANGKNVTIPTNIDVSDAVKDKFAAFYTALFDKTIENNPGAVVTEYAWQASTCDPCPGPALNARDFATLGADVLGGQAQPAYRIGASFVLTRLHARYGKAISDDLRFRAAPPIAGGREVLQNGQGGLEEGAQPAAQNNFQGRYAIRHPWTGPIRCEHPHRKIWGGPPLELATQPGFSPTGIRPAVGLAFAPRGQIDLGRVVRRDVPELGIRAGKPVNAIPPSGPPGAGSGSTSAAPASGPPGAGSGSTSAAPASGSAGTGSGSTSAAPANGSPNSAGGSASAAPASGSAGAGSASPRVSPRSSPADRAGARSGCGCASAGGGGVGAGALVLAAAAWVGRRRRSRPPGRSVGSGG